MALAQTSARSRRRVGWFFVGAGVIGDIQETLRLRRAVCNILIESGAELSNRSRRSMSSETVPPINWHCGSREAE
jgi:hypothetical protein